MQLVLSLRSALALGGIGLAILASGWRPHNHAGLDARVRALEAVLTPENGVKLMQLLPHIDVVQRDNGDGFKRQRL